MNPLRNGYIESIKVLAEYVTSIRRHENYNDFDKYFTDCLYQSGGITLPKSCHPFWTASFNPGGKCFLSYNNSKGHTITLHVEAKEFKERCRQIWKQKKSKQLTIF